MAGLVVRITLDIVKFSIGEFLRARADSCKLFGNWIFNAIYALAGVSFWRGVWFLLRIDVGIETYKLLFVLLGSLVVLVLNKVPKSLISSSMFSSPT